ncbi:hypothetical protein AB0K16_19855 [Nonomuraea jabiensis]|uniref:hypothetical protein n=1 Tax=Nonomuraea jabiensis TaxID=882448 RepID=UPI003441CEA0
MTFPPAPRRVRLVCGSEMDVMGMVKAEITTRRLVPEAVADYLAEHMAAHPRHIQR